jgi:hypothetical protein
MGSGNHQEQRMLLAVMTTLSGMMGHTRRNYSSNSGHGGIVAGPNIKSIE